MKPSDVGLPEGVPPETRPAEDDPGFGLNPLPSAWRAAPAPANPPTPSSPVPDTAPQPAHHGCRPGPAGAAPERRTTMTNPLATDIEATAQWLEQHAANGAALLLRRVARQRDQAQRELAAERNRNRYLLAWRSARRRARTNTAELTSLSEQLDDVHQLWGADCERFNAHAQQASHANNQLVAHIKQLQIHAERAGWIDDPEGRRAWRWRDGWWELAYRRRKPRDGYPRSGWYLWGPAADSPQGEWAARLKPDALTEAERHLTRHITATTEANRG
jgi:hypothetical protein